MEERERQQRLAMTLTIINLALLAVLVVIGLILYNSVRGAIDSVEDNVESVTGVVQSMAGSDLPSADELQGWLDDFNSQSGDTGDLESRLEAIEAKVGSTQSVSQLSDEDILFEIFPELRFDGMLSEGCANAMRSEIRRRFAGSSDFAERRDVLNGVDTWSSHPYSQLSGGMLYEVGNWIDEIAYSRGWSDWQGDGYRVYDRSHDEIGAGASGTLPCISEREGVSVFSDVRNESPMGRFRGEVIDNYWGCVGRIQEEEERNFEPTPTPTPSFYEEGYVQACRIYAERYAQWLPPFPGATPASSR